MKTISAGIVTCFLPVITAPMKPAPAPAPAPMPARKSSDSGADAHDYRPAGEEVLELDDDVLGRLEGGSSLGRIGIIVHGTAGLLDPGWSGKATLELSNLGRMPVALYPRMRICSFTFEQLSTRVAVSYRNKVGNKYSGQDRPLASKLASESGE